MRRKALRLALRLLPRGMPSLFPSWFPDLLPRSFDRQQVISRDFLGQLVVFLKAVVVMAAVLTLVWGMHRNVTSRWIHDVPPSLAVACLMVQFILALLGLILSGASKKREQRRQRRAVHLLPVIRKRLAAYALPQQNQPDSHKHELSLLHARHPREFEICLLEFLNNSSGQAREQLSDLAQSLGFVAAWQHAAIRDGAKRTQAIESLSLLSTHLGIPVLQALTDDNSPLVRAAALKALTNLSARNHTERPPSATAPGLNLAVLFRTAVSSPLLVRVILAADLRRHASALAQNGIPELLRSERRLGPLLAALEMIESWRCGLPVKDLQSLLHHSEARVRAAALRLVPLESLHSGANGAWTTHSFQTRSNATSLAPLVIGGLLDADPRVKAAALSAAAGLKIPSALPLIEHCADTEDNQLASLACLALASMGPQGRAILQSKIHGGHARLAASAVEALAGVQLANAAAFQS